MSIRLYLFPLIIAACLDGGTSAAEQGPEVIRPAPQAEKPATRVLTYSLLIDDLDKVEGNAAPMWIRAGLSARGVPHKWTEAEEKWHSVEQTPLSKFPRKQVRATLGKFEGVFRLCQRAALCKRCDWEYPPLTIQNMGDMPLADVQMMRELIKLLSLRCRLHLSEQRFEEAGKDLRIGLTLAQHVGDSQFLIQDLVALALTSIMLSRVEEWVSIPGSPNLYWALTELPRPLISVRRSARSELGTIYRSFPTLRELKEKKLTVDEANTLVQRFFKTFLQLAGESGPDWRLQLGIATLAMKYYPLAKKGLLERGMSEKEVEALPTTQAVALYHLQEYDRVRDEFLKCLTLPSWQAYEEMQKVDRVETPKAKQTGNLVMVLMMPALTKMFLSEMRIERHLAGLRTVEAIRMHRAKQGKLPAKLSEIREVPLPIDPVTGKGFDEGYQREKDHQAVLNVPPLPERPAREGKRYEFTFKDR